MTTVLVVDDSPVDRKLAGRLLEKGGDIEVHYAENGRDALDSIRQALPDAVVTDLQMPEMDGLELVTALRAGASAIPVILITAHGSEQLAVSALRNGAAGYVPKEHLAELLRESVLEVTAIARSKKNYSRLSEALVRSEYGFSLENDPELVEPLIDMFEDLVLSMNLFDPTDRHRVGVALQKAVFFAMFRGNLEITFDELSQGRTQLAEAGRFDLLESRRQSEPYASRRVKVDFHISPDAVKITVAHQGPPIDLSDLPTPDDPAMLLREDCRDIVLMQSFMDKVTFEDSGKTVALVKERSE